MSASPGSVAMPRGRGAASGLLILLLGVWGGLAPFVGPLFDWTIGSDEAWDFTTSRIVLQLAPGAAAAVGGLLLLLAANRVAAVLGSLLAIAGGAWLCVGVITSTFWNDGTPDVGPALGDATRAAAEYLTLFYGLGALLCVLGGFAFARVTARFEGDRERLGAPAPAPSRAPTQPYRGRPAPAAAPAQAPVGDTRVMGERGGAAADPGTRDTRVLGGTGTGAATSEAGTQDTRVLGDRPEDEAGTRDTRVLGGDSKDEAGTRDTRVLGGTGDEAGTRDTADAREATAPRDRDDPPPPDPATRAG